mmetsp:Transcript_5326/g.21772  ORF Transcript_5326/g.21772 Transcript_5326/m.21772 type:complete len:465 (+) Transcript_5326:40-1434(+)
MAPNETVGCRLVNGRWLHLDPTDDPTFESLPVFVGYDTGIIHSLDQPCVPVYPGYEKPEGPLDEIDCEGMSVMPGMIDSHVHVTASSADLRKPAFMTPSLLYARSVLILEGMLMRGFTTVRDCGGADHGLAAATEEGTLRGPRIIYCGKALSQTGGHGDFRAAAENQLPFGSCRCCNFTIGRVCDGVAACREAVRDEVRKGCSHIKVMASGGVASPTDRLENLQFSEEELRAIIEEANNAKIYCAAHAYTDEAIERAVRCGVRSIEHGNFAEDKTLQMMHDKEVFLVPTLITYDRLTKEGVAGGMPQELVDEVGGLVEHGQLVVKRAIELNVGVCYGSDLLGDMHKWQAHGIDLHLRAGVSNSDLLKSLVHYPNYMIWPDTVSTDTQVPPDGELHYRGSRADLLVVKGDVAKDPRLLMDPENIKVIIKNGKIVKNELGFKNQEETDSFGPDGKDQTIESKRARR